MTVLVGVTVGVLVGETDGVVVGVLVGVGDIKPQQPNDDKLNPVQTFVGVVVLQKVPDSPSTHVAPEGDIDEGVPLQAV